MFGLLAKVKRPGIQLDLFEKIVLYLFCYMPVKCGDARM